MEIPDYYVKSAPSVQNTLDIFQGEWASKLPGDLSLLNAGQSGLFEDGRITWAIEQLGGVTGQTILELGPLEAGHTYMLEKLGAASITAVEASTRAYLKCLIVKEVVGLRNAHFLCGDCVEYLRSNPGKFDTCFASGILYHMTNPAELIGLIAKVSDRVFIWTHYYDENIMRSTPYLSPRFAEKTAAEYQGFKHMLYRQEYGEYKGEVKAAGFCGGSSRFSNWMSREDIMSCLTYFGLTDIRINFDQPHTPHGPCFALVAMRR
ncbi:MAG: class I SAM-dependent methyltransferase [Microcoleus sp.]